MNRNIPKDWVEVSEREFEYLTANIDWHRDAWGNGDFYYRGTMRDARVVFDNGKFYTWGERGQFREPINTSFGVRIDSTPPRYLINPEVFKPAQSTLVSPPGQPLGCAR